MCQIKLINNKISNNKNQPENRGSCWKYSTSVGLQMSLGIKCLYGWSRDICTLIANWSDVFCFLKEMLHLQI